MKKFIRSYTLKVKNFESKPFQFFSLKSKVLTLMIEYLKRYHTCKY